MSSSFRCVKHLTLVVYFVVKIGGGRINRRLCPRKASYCRMHMVFMLNHQHLAPTYYDCCGKNCLKETWSKQRLTQVYRNISRFQQNNRAFVDATDLVHPWMTPRYTVRPWNCCSVRRMALAGFTPEPGTKLCPASHASWIHILPSPMTLEPCLIRHTSTQMVDFPWFSIVMLVFGWGRW